MAAAPLPHPAVQAVLLPAYAPCARFGQCPQARWAPSVGHVPRGFLGASGALEDVRVVMVVAEPGGVYPGDRYDDRLSPADLLAATVAAAHRILSSPRDLFHRNVRWFIDRVAPGLNFEEQLRHIWLTEGRLCSVDTEIGGLKDRGCADLFLARQVPLFSNAVTVGFGGKAQDYLKRLGIPHEAAYALAPPGANHRPARPSWDRALAQIATRR